MGKYGASMPPWLPLNLTPSYIMYQDLKPLIWVNYNNSLT